MQSQFIRVQKSSE